MQTSNEINHLISKTYVKSPGRHFKSIDPLMYHFPASPKVAAKLDQFNEFVNSYSSAYYR